MALIWTPQLNLQDFCANKTKPSTSQELTLFKNKIKSTRKQSNTTDFQLLNSARINLIFSFCVCFSTLVRHKQVYLVQLWNLDWGSKRDCSKFNTQQQADFLSIRSLLTSHSTHFDVHSFIIQPTSRCRLWIVSAHVTNVDRGTLTRQAPTNEYMKRF